MSYDEAQELEKGSVHIDGCLWDHVHVDRSPACLLPSSSDFRSQPFFVLRTRQYHGYDHTWTSEGGSEFGAASGTDWVNNLFSHWLGANSTSCILLPLALKVFIVVSRPLQDPRVQVSRPRAPRPDFQGLQVQDYMYLLNGSLANPVLMPALGTVSIEQHSKKYPEIHNADDQPVEESPAMLRSNVMDEAEVLVYVGDGTPSPSICPVALRGVAYGGNVDTQLAATQSWLQCGPIQKWAGGQPSAGWFQLTAVSLSHVAAHCRCTSLLQAPPTAQETLYVILIGANEAFFLPTVNASQLYVQPSLIEQVPSMIDVSVPTALRDSR
ncbi:hypothetical protein K438DRAFT_1767077 [Mycena galopus ATCC 62051]|nr:hypothetical protein K438DRAFT_1767077 [Mycena galopus ATCC 62051]